MANANTMCVSALVEMMNATHAIGSPPVAQTLATKNVYKAALYVATGTKGHTTTAFTTSDPEEVTGTGYTTGGVTVTNATVPTFSSKTAFWTPSASFVYTTVTLTTAFDAVMIYNSTHTTKYALSVHTFGSQTVTAGTFTLTMPVNDANTGLIRLTVLP